MRTGQRGKGRRMVRAWLERGVLRAADQVCCAVVLTVSWVVLTGSWLYYGGLSGRIIDIERAEQRMLRFGVDINQADWPEWALLPGIGDMLAQRIVDSRRHEGPFQRHEDLLRVRGIGPRILDRIRPYLLPVEEPGLPVPEG